MEASYKKLRDGSWGIRTTDGIPDVGDTVEVVTKSGEAKQEEVSRVIWSGTNDDGNEASICEIVQTDRDGNPIRKPKQQQGNQRQTGQQKQSTSKCKCLGCGTTDPSKEYYCSDCVLSGSAQQTANSGGNGSNEGEEEPSDDIPF
jgi:hypothetical protein